MVLEKTLESPLECKEILPVHSEGDQPWDFFGRNDAKAETPVLWPPLHMRWPKYWSFSFSISPSSQHPGLIFRMDWLDLLAVQGTLKSLLQHHSSKASILWCLASFTVQLSHPYMTTGKTIALTRWTFWQSNVSAI